MTLDQVQVQAIACLVALACALPGVFLVLRGMAMMSDAISHVVLLGIVLGFLVTRDIASPWLLLAATLSGMATVGLVEAVYRTRLLKQDASIGLVFPLLFSIAIILISRFAGNVHLDTDAVLAGELGLASLDRLVVAGQDWGPRSLWLMAGVLALNLSFIVVFYKELKLATFDPALAATLGLLPVLLHYALMLLVSVTAVAAFDAVGSILVVALMIAPAATAYLLTDSLTWMLVLASAAAVASALGGYWVADALRDVPISGCMAVMTGVVFALAFAFAPHRGMVSIARRRRRQRLEFSASVLTVHLLHHEGTPAAEVESRIEHLHDRLRWPENWVARVLQHAVREGLVVSEDGSLTLTDGGRSVAREALVG